jgi:hypothetical protein
LTVAVATGGVVFEVTVTDAEPIQPFVVLVTVTVYVPAAVTVLVAPVPPPLHAYVTPVDGVAVKVASVFVHDKFLFVVAPAVGGVVFEVTVTDAVPVQPFTISVTVTVYVPAAVTTLVALVPPPLHA